MEFSVEFAMFLLYAIAFILATYILLIKGE